MQYRGVHSIVTGGSSGMGRALVDRLVDRGSHVSILVLDDADLGHVAADYAGAAGQLRPLPLMSATKCRSRRQLPLPTCCTDRVTYS